MPSAISVKKLTKHYGKLKALNNVSFEVQKGEIFGLLGPNGSGKTTLIHCLTQLANFTSGIIKIHNHNIKEDYLQAKRHIGLSPQEPVSDFYFSLLKTLCYQAGYFSIPHTKAKQTALKLLKDLNLYDKKDAKFRMLSGGMKRKFSLAKALIHKPDILILDEPTAALDVDARHELWEYVKKLHKQGVTIFLTTHYIEEAQMLCDRICILNKGKIVKIEKTKALLKDFSQNIIKILLTKKTVLPKDMHKFTYELNENELHITTSYKDQSKNLKEALTILESNNIKYNNFTILPDNLENIFRRLVK